MVPAPAPSAPMTRREWGGRVASIVIMTLALVEAGARLATGSLFTLTSPDDRERHRERDPVVGFVPKAGVRIRPRKGSFTISTVEHGTRSNGPVPAAADRPRYLVVGDSFAFGDDVDDDRTWPAALERLARHRVVNAAVPGFGLDQAVLRAEALAPIYTPDAILVSFIPHDVSRCEMAWWSGNPKPHFDLGEANVLRYVAAPVDRTNPALRSLKRGLSHSVALDVAFQKQLHADHPDEIVHRRGAEVACLLMDRLVALRAASRAQIGVVAQPQRALSRDDERALKDRVLNCARERGLLAIDLFPVVDAVPSDERARLFHGHMTAPGNALVAEQLNALLAAPAGP